jgi:uncharacterized membrane protein YgcG
MICLPAASLLALPTWRATILVPFFCGSESTNRAGWFLSGDQIVGKKLYVGNLSYSVTNASLEQMFVEFGEVRSAEVIQDRDTGRSKGFGFVEMADDNAAREAIKGLHEKEFDGRALTVNEARPREERSGGGGGGGGRGYGGGGGGGRGYGGGGGGGYGGGRR